MCYNQLDGEGAGVGEAEVHVGGVSPGQRGRERHVGADHVHVRHHAVTHHRDRHPVRVHVEPKYQQSLIHHLYYKNQV